MNHSNNRGSISTASSGVAWKPGEVVSDQFPAGLRVLVVDDDPTCLMILGKMLRTCRYEVKTCNRAEIALSLLRENPNGYDIVISDVHMPDMDGFKLLEDIGLEMDLPVIMMSADDEKHVVMKGVTHGACDYLIKPVRIEALKTIWQHVVRKKKTEWKDLEQSGSAEECDRQTKQSEEADYSSAGNSEGNWRSTKKRKDEEEEAEDRDDSSTLKKPRVVWSVELHQQFVAAVNQLGIDKAVPKKILELMSVPGLTRENVASHLQKYRLYLRRLSGVSQHQNNLGNSFLSSQEASYGPLASLNGLDLQTLAAAGQLPAQSLATLQAGGLGRQAVKSRIPMPIIEQRNIFSFDNSKLRFGEAQQQHLSNKQMNLLHGIPTNMEPKQLANLQHSAQSIGNINIPVNVHGSGGQSGQGNSLLMQMTQQQSRGQILNESPGSHPPRLPTSMGQLMMSNAVSGGMLATNGLAENGRGAGYSPVSQPSPILNYPLGNTAELTSNSFPLGSSPGITSLQSKGSFQDEINSDIKAPAGFIPSYDIFNELQQHKSHDWELQNVALPFTASQRANSLQSNSLDTGSSILTHQGFSSSQRNGQNSEMSTLGKAMFTSGNLSEHANVQNVARMNSFFGENPVRVKTEADQETNCQTGLFPEQFGQEDLMSALLKQQQGGMAPSENEFDFDGYNMDNIPV